MFGIKIFNISWCIFRKIPRYGHNCISKSFVHAAKDTFSKDSNKKTRSTPLKKRYSHIVDSNVAESIASYISDDWKNGLVLEANPGPGKLSSHLLQKRIKLLRVFEKNEDFLPELRALKFDYPNLEVIEEDLFFLPVFESKLHNEPQLLETFFQGIPDQEWTDGIPIRVFSIITNQRGIKFLRYLLSALPKRTSLFTFGRCQFFFLTTETEFKYMTAVPKENFAMYRWTTVLYNLFFEIKLLEKFSSEIIAPINSSRRLKKGSEDCKSVYLVQLTPKKDIFSNKVNGDKLSELYFFVRHHFIKRKALVIPTLEGWVPHCGPRLIKEGMNVFTKFGDLSPYQILLLFNQFSSWPEYPDSAFATAASRYLGREHSIYEDYEKEPESME